MRRSSAALVGASLLAGALAGCGGDEPVALDDDPVAAAPTGTPQAGDEEQLRDLVAAYDESLDEAQRLRGDAAAFEGVLTEELAATYARNFRDNVYGAGLEEVGSWTLEPGEVSVTGDEATVEVCSDGSQVYVVEQGAGIGDGARNQGRIPQVLTAERVDGTWLVAGAAAGGQACA